MDYKEYTILKNWEDLSTEDVIKCKKKYKKVLFYTNENYMFTLFFLLVMSPVIVCFLVGAIRFALFLSVPFLIFHFFYWFLLLRGLFIKPEIREAAIELNMECDIVLKNRMYNKTKNPD